MTNKFMRYARAVVLPIMMLGTASCDTKGDPSPVGPGKEPGTGTGTDPKAITHSVIGTTINTMLFDLADSTFVVTGGTSPYKYSKKFKMSKDGNIALKLENTQIESVNTTGYDAKSRVVNFKDYNNFAIEISNAKEDITAKSTDGKENAQKIKNQQAYQPAVFKNVKNDEQLKAFWENMSQNKTNWKVVVEKDYDEKFNYNGKPWELKVN